MSSNLDNLYTFVIHRATNQQYIKILDGPLSGAVVDIYLVQLPSPQQLDNNPTVQIKYNFIEQPTEVVDNQQVSQILGVIAMDIIQNNNLSDYLTKK